ILATMQGRVWDLTVSRDALPHFKENYLVSHINQRPDGVQLRIVHNEAPASTATIAHPNLEDAFLGYTS
ncbi:MAG: ABC transporter ATP-binding protein, partial [Chloroflexi bacterium]|nr:ABC transporter ATP-binding protein [Chloroflexota bacterium]